jgi:hypothetical protein
LGFEQSVIFQSNRPERIDWILLKQGVANQPSATYLIGFGVIGRKAIKTAPSDKMNCTLFTGLAVKRVHFSQGLS